MKKKKKMNNKNIKKHSNLINAFAVNLCESVFVYDYKCIESRLNLVCVLVYLRKYLFVDSECDTTILQPLGELTREIKAMSSESFK